MEEEIQNIIDVNATANQYGVAKVPVHTHNGSDSLQIDIANIARYPSFATDGQVAAFSTAMNQWVATTIAGTGTVTSFSSPNGNGFTKTVSSATTTPQLTWFINVAGVLYSDGAGNLQGSTIAADTTKFLNGGTNPAFSSVNDSDLALTDITTNNVSATKHGFAPKFPNNTTTFLRGDGTYAAPSVAGITYARGITSRSAATGTGTQNIAHGLGVAPAVVRIYATASAGTVGAAVTIAGSSGEGDATTYACSWWTKGNTIQGFGGTASKIIELFANDGTTLLVEAVISAIDATNITINFTTLSGTNVVCNFMWAANT